MLSQGSFLHNDKVKNKSAYWLKRLGAACKSYQASEERI